MSGEFGERTRDQRLSLGSVAGETVTQRARGSVVMDQQAIPVPAGSWDSIDGADDNKGCRRRVV